MKAFSFLTVFLLAGFFLVSFVYYAEAGIPGACVNGCRGQCFEVYKDRCQGETGEAKRECITVANILAQCCYSNCLEVDCGGDEAPEQSTVCQLLEEECGLFPD